MKKQLTLDRDKKVFPIILLVLGAAIMLLEVILHLNIMGVVGMLYCCIVSLIIFIGAAFKAKVYLYTLLGYAAAGLGNFLFHVIWGADAGFGALISGKIGFLSAENPLVTGEGSFFTRLAGNLLLCLPCLVCLVVLVLLSAKKQTKRPVLMRVCCAVMSVLLMGTSVIYVLTSNMRTRPKTQRMWEGHDDYLGNVDKTASSESPNVLFILMDDLGYGDVSLNGSLIQTPNIDSIGENGLNFTNFYSSYSVCSPSRFAAMTGRYPYRGYADNVCYPTVNTLAPFAATRIFNSIEMGGNVDGMLGDEITIAEVFKAAGYNTGAFGKWHLGDYGEYLPTNQGFDYFYGSHHVNDMTPFYHVREQDGEYEIVQGTKELKDQSEATKLIHEEINAWVTQMASQDAPFFAYYATPWPHAPIYVSDEFEGVSGLGDYADCVEEFDYYLGLLFDTLEQQGVMEDTIIVFTSDNGPALQGSVGEFRGGKYLAYDGGQKEPFMIRWDNSDGALGKAGSVRTQTATLADLFPTLIDLCGITGNSGTASYLPTDRVIDGVSMAPLLKNDEVIHTSEHPILHMKREDIKAIQYTVPTAQIKSRYEDYDYEVLNENENITFKYFDRIQNDNSAFFDKYRKNWLHILTDDVSESYNRTTVYPEIADEMHAKLDEIQKQFKENRRGILT